MTNGENGNTDEQARREIIKKFIFDVMPILVAMFCIVTVTLLSPLRWVTAIIQMPVWIGLIWWLYVKEEYYGDS